MSQKNEQIKFEMSDEDIKSINTNIDKVKSLKIAKLSPNEMQQLNGGFAIRNHTLGRSSAQLNRSSAQLKLN
ncbi:hypothetical protein BMF77_pa00030 (plasmid) [Dolichospermum sp. UHCC 0315A]|uniref:hypothetical protein n=1 Tax=Dolichospermum sp. UHCC 0315A TaxID=1914871 RepID=UPI0011E7CC2A|nr:hypothetical protein [Dolichospermum sp. UHCC 0315A]QEI44315.1 hypothetical protein BMF77_04947 [Dolichospermum sp. UHCC 0315A]QEI44372.1 hypothetical protein BMF77_pa00030 [Dolichospermum sp. UHCC 0315A]